VHVCMSCIVGEGPNGILDANSPVSHGIASFRLLVPSQDTFLC